MPVDDGAQRQLNGVIIRYMKRYNLTYQAAVNKIRIDLIRNITNVTDNPRPWHKGLGR